MSADSWTVCPRCEKRRLALLAIDQAKLDAAYGKVSLADFDAMRAALEDRLSTQPPHTFREDYEFYGAEEGTLGVSYKGACRTCDLRFTLTQQHDMGA